MLDDKVTNKISELQKNFSSDQLFSNQTEQSAAKVPQGRHLINHPNRKCRRSVTLQSGEHRLARRLHLRLIKYRRCVTYC